MLPSGWMRSTLPLRLFLFCALLPFCASPVEANRNWPSGLNRSRPPLWNLFFRIPLSSTCSELMVTVSVVGLYLNREIRLSLEVVRKTYSQWSVLNDFGLISRPSRPPSPSVLCVFGKVPRFFLAPVFGFRWTMLCASRSLYSSVPSGMVTRPQTTSSSVPTCFAAQTLAQPVPVFTDTELLMADLLPAGSRACTV